MHELEDYIYHGLHELSIFSPSEIRQIYLNSDVPLEDLLDVIEILDESEISFSEKVTLLKEKPYGMEVLVLIATMDR